MERHALRDDYKFVDDIGVKGGSDYQWYIGVANWS